MSTTNSNLSKARKAKNDEFYTRLEDIQKELAHYQDRFIDKIVYLNCDDPEHSNFWKYFHDNFGALRLKKLICTYYRAQGPVFKTEYNGTNISRAQLIGNGDFRNKECIDILSGADIVVTNPPFSLFREYMAQLQEYNKKFLIIGNKNAITYKEFFPLLKDNKVWIGYTNVQEFATPTGTQKFGNIGWFTNLDIKKRHESIILWKEFSEAEYPKYDNYDAINVDKVTEIPDNYYGVMGVPITFLDKHNPEQFEILGSCEPAIALSKLRSIKGFKEYISRQVTVVGVPCQKIYKRLLIRRKNSKLEA